MLKEVIYISSDERSGSTMLDLLLGNHSQITSLGEVQHLNAYVTGNRKYYNPKHPLRCMCGQKVGRCEFWNRIQDALPIPFSELRLRLRHQYKDPIKNIGNIILSKTTKKIRQLIPEILKNNLIIRATGYNRVAMNRFLLYNAAAEASGTPFVVDSSKLPHRISYLYHYKPDKIKVILLYRNPEAVVYSKMKRGIDIERASKIWADTTRKMELYSRNISDENKIKVRYENICEKTTEEMQRICDFLQIDYEPSMSIMNKKGRHHIGGSPSKFDKKRNSIELDEQYLKELSDIQIKKIDSIIKCYS